MSLLREDGVDEVYLGLGMKGEKLVGIGRVLCPNFPNVNVPC